MDSHGSLVSPADTVVYNWLAGLLCKLWARAQEHSVRATVMPIITVDMTTMTGFATMPEAPVEAPVETPVAVPGAQRKRKAACMSGVQNNATKKATASSSSASSSSASPSGRSSSPPPPRHR